MPTTPTAELYFIAGAFVLIFLICAVSVYVFFRQLKREKGKGASVGGSNDTTNADAQEEE